MNILFKILKRILALSVFLNGLVTVGIIWILFTFINSGDLTVQPMWSLFLMGFCGFAGIIVGLIMFFKHYK